MKKPEKPKSSRNEPPRPALYAWYCSTFDQAMTGAALLWVALPPLDVGPLAFVAPIWWVLLIRRKRLPGRWPYRSLWLAGCLFWVAALHWLRLPHWLTGFGWIAMGCYMGVYLPLFIGLARVAVHQLRFPVIFAAPLVWMGLELGQGHALTGFTMGGLGHTQHRWLDLIQISDLVGAYGVGFFVMFVAACLARAFPIERQPLTWKPLIPAGGVLFAVLLYGHLRISTPSSEADARIALIQGSIDTVLSPPPERREEMFRQYCDLTQEAVTKYGKQGIDLLVWPETVFYGTLIGSQQADVSDKEPDGLGRSERDYRRYLVDQDKSVRELMVALAEHIDAPSLVGINRKDLSGADIKSYNSAAFIGQDGEVIGVYDKMHRVVFGEYVPFSNELSWLIALTPVNSLNLAINAGTQPAAFRLSTSNQGGSDGRAPTDQNTASELDDRGLWIAPNICYESVLPHLIRRQVNTLARQGRDPDVLINLTNDGWFWGSSELDMHLACAIFRAVECRKPFLIAANTGFSAWIDADGRLRAQGPRRDTGMILAEVELDDRTSWYLRYGDIPAGICLCACALFALVGVYHRWRNRRTGSDGVDTINSTPTS